MLDKYAPYVLSAFAVTWVVLGAYLLYLRSRLAGLRKWLGQEQGDRRV